MEIVAKSFDSRISKLWKYPELESVGGSTEMRPIASGKLGAKIDGLLDEVLLNVSEHVILTHSRSVFSRIQRRIAEGKFPCWRAEVQFIPESKEELPRKIYFDEGARPLPAGLPPEFWGEDHADIRIVLQCRRNLPLR